MLAGMLIVSVVFFLIVYRLYGRFMSRVYQLDPNKKTPAEEINDGVDYCPAHPAVLTGHHFASIAGAGPIVGPIAAAALFGWVPAFLWCLLGAAFLGGVKGQLDAQGYPSGSDLPGLQRTLLKDLFGWTPADFDAAWTEWAQQPR